jgi:hypothetical protein
MPSSKRTPFRSCSIFSFENKKTSRSYTNGFISFNFAAFATNA